MAYTLTSVAVLKQTRTGSASTELKRNFEGPRLAPRRHDSRTTRFLPRDPAEANNGAGVTMMKAFKAKKNIPERIEVCTHLHRI